MLPAYCSEPCCTKPMAARRSTRVDRRCWSHASTDAPQRLSRSTMPGGLRKRRAGTGYADCMPKDPSVQLELDGFEVSISNPNKVHFPEAGITKRDLVDYYLAV